MPLSPGDATAGSVLSAAAPICWSSRHLLAVPASAGATLAAAHSTAAARMPVLLMMYFITALPLSPVHRCLRAVAPRPGSTSYTSCLCRDAGEIIARQIAFLLDRTQLDLGDSAHRGVFPYTSTTPSELVPTPRSPTAQAERVPGTALIALIRPNDPPMAGSVGPLQRPPV